MHSIEDEVAREAQFLCDRLDDFNPDDEDAARLYYGHVEPSHERLKRILQTASTITAVEGVDPDMLEARVIALRIVKAKGYLHTDGDYLLGHQDQHDTVQAAYLGIKHTRALTLPANAGAGDSGEAVELDNGKIAPPPSEPMDPEERRRLIAELTEKIKAEHAALSAAGREGESKACADALTRMVAIDEKIEASNPGYMDGEIGK